MTKPKFTEEEHDARIRAYDDALVVIVTKMLKELDMCPHCLAQSLGRALGSYVYHAGTNALDTDGLYGAATREAAECLAFLEDTGSDQHGSGTLQ